MRPFVSVCTPTYNRRKFIPKLIEYIQNQTYPQDRIEWLMYDDGDDSIADLVETIKNVRYYYTKERRTLGFKRNYLNKRAKGDIIVCMDDDDIYPTERIEHAVETLLTNPQVKCVGCSEIYVLFKKREDEIWKFGPYNTNHATSATMAYRKELVNMTTFDENVKSCEEKSFLKGYTIPMVQLDPFRTVLAVAHDTNTVDKKYMITDKYKKKTKATKCVDDVAKYFLM
jgi:glycosyltransferase involved in cell wall biosynthesis